MNDEDKTKMIHIFKRDSEFLMKRNIMDYSILFTIEKQKSQIF